MDRKYHEIVMFGKKMEENVYKYIVVTNALLHLHDWKQLIQTCDKALDITTKEPQFYHLKGKALGKLGNHQRKVQLIQKAIELRSDVPAYHRNIGAGFYSLKNYEKALEHHLKAIEL